jgi:hypothetical protein
MIHPPALFSGDLDIEAHSEAAEVSGEACQLVAQLTHLIPNADKWLDNLSEAKLVHKGLLPVIIKPSAAPKSTGDAS